MKLSNWCNSHRTMYSTANEVGVGDAATKRNRENIFEIILSGGPPWGFTLTGGSEFGSKLYVKKVFLNFLYFNNIFLQFLTFFFNSHPRSQIPPTFFSSSLDLIFFLPQDFFLKLIFCPFLNCWCIRF